MARRARSAYRSACALGLALLAGAPACVTDHDALAKRPDAGNGGGGRTGGAAGAFPNPRAGAESGGSGGRVPDEPPGENVLTLVNGIVDAPEVRLCFRIPSADGARFVAAPAGAGAFAYATSLVIRELEDVDFASDDVEPVVIAGELDLVVELDCEVAIEVAAKEQAAAEPRLPAGSGGEGGGAAEAAPDEAAVGGEGGARDLPTPPAPRLRTASLPIVPAGSLTHGRSALYAATGCIGGPAFVARRADVACGADYSGRAPSLGAVWVNLSRRTRFGSLGLQVVQASRATDSVSVQSRRIGPSSEPPVSISAFVSYGAISPRTAHLEASSSDYGANTQLFAVEAQTSSGTASYETWQAIRARANLATVEDGASYALVIVGPSVGFYGSGFWNPPAFALVPTDPVPEEPSAAQ